MAPSNEKFDAWLVECIKRALVVMNEANISVGPMSLIDSFRVRAFDRVLQKIIKEGYDPRL